MIVGEHPLKDLYRRAVWGPARAALEAAPAPLELAAVATGGALAAALLSGKRQHLAENLARAFPQHSPDELDALARQAFQAHLANQYISFSFSKCDARTWSRYLLFRGLDRLAAASALGRGVVLMHPHMGPAQLPLHALGVLGWPMHQIGGGRVTLVELSATGRWAAERRAALERRMPVTLHDGRRFLRPALRALKGGAVLMTACDATGGGEELGRRRLATVLGQRYPVPVGPVWLALTSGAPLLTLATHRNHEPGPPYVVEIGEALDFPRDQGKEQALAVGGAQTARFLDRALRAWPGDWLFWDGFEPGGLLEGAP